MTWGWVGDIGESGIGQQNPFFCPENSSQTPLHLNTMEKTNGIPKSNRAKTFMFPQI